MKTALKPSTQLWDFKIKTNIQNIHTNSGVREVYFIILKLYGIQYVKYWHLIREKKKKCILTYRLTQKADWPTSRNAIHSDLGATIQYYFWSWKINDFFFSFY